MATVAVKPVEAEWLDAVYKLTNTPRPESSDHAENEEDDKLKEKLKGQYKELQKRFKAVKGTIPAALVRKINLAGKDLEAGYKISALEERLEELDGQIATLESGGFTPDSQEWTFEARGIVENFQKSCNEVQGALVKQVQQRAQTLAKTETDSLRKKRLNAAAQESKVDFISVPVGRVAERFEQDLILGGEQKKNQTLAKYQQELKATQTDIEKIIAGKKFVAVVRLEQKGREKERADQARSKAVGLALNKIKVLGELDRAQGKKFADEVNRADSAKAVKAIELEIDEAIESLQVTPSEITAKQEEFGTKAAGVTKALKGKKGEQAAKLQDLENGLNGAKALAATGNKKVTEAAEKLAGQMSAAAADPNVGKVFQTIEDLNKEIADKHLKAFYPHEQASFVQTLKKLGADVNPMDLEPSQLALAKASQQIKALVDGTKARLEWQKKTKERFGRIGARLNMVMPDLRIITGKSGLLQKRKELNKAYMSPDAVMKDLDKEIAEFERQINAIVRYKFATPPNKDALKRALEADKTAGVAIKEKRSQRAKVKKDLATDRKRLQSDFKKEKSKVKGDPALEVVAGYVEELLKTAQQMIKADQLDAAAKKIKLAREKIGEMQGSDPAVASGTAKYLREEASKGWVNATKGITKSIGDILTKAVKVADDKEAGKVTGILEGIKAEVFGPDVFTSKIQPPLNQLLAERDPNKKKAAREKVLVQVRYVRKQLESNEVLMQLRVNPFRIKMSTLGLNAFLDDLELKTSMAMALKK
jgi:hypothetical protein